MATEHRRRAAAGLALGLIVSTMAAATLTAEATTGARAAVDRAWWGFGIATTGQAAGSWIGARKVGRKPGRIVYRIDPRADPRVDGFGKVRRIGKLPGPGIRSAAGPRSTARAAWILSKYGTFANDFQSAAVDAAVLHLLARRGYRLNGRYATARLRQSGEPAAIRRLASIMLIDSARRAGPYRVVAQPVGHPGIGDPVRVTVQAVVDRSGVPLSSVPVSLRVGGGPWRSAGETDAAGRATFGYVDPTAGPKPVLVRVGRAPETHLLVMSPRRGSASRVAVAGRKRTLGARTVVYVKARPNARVSSALIAADSRTSGKLRISDAYATAPRRAGLVLHGPFDSFKHATCRRNAFRSRGVAVTGDGQYRLPALVLHRAGIYVWRVAVPGDHLNTAVTTCDGPFRVTPRD